MIAATQDTLDVLTEGKRLLICEEDNPQSLGFRFIQGSFFLTIGLMVLWLFIGGGGPTLKADLASGQKVVAFGFVGLFLVGLGVVPLCLGLGVLFLRDRFVFDTGSGRIESHTTVFGRTIRQREFVLKKFDSVVTERRRMGGALASQVVFVVKCSSADESLDVVNCRTAAQASELAGRIAQHTGLLCADT